MKHVDPNTIEIVMERSLHVECKITESMWRGLRAIRQRLLSGEMRHVENVGHDAWLIYDLNRLEYDLNRRESASLFNMDFWIGRTPCGTCHCIGGELECMPGVNREQLVLFAKDHAGLCNLFNPSVGEQVFTYNLSAITAEEAAMAIDNFTVNTPGNASWIVVLPRAYSDPHYVG